MGSEPVETMRLKPRSNVVPRLLDTPTRFAGPPLRERVPTIHSGGVAPARFNASPKGAIAVTFDIDTVTATVRENAALFDPSPRRERSTAAKSGTESRTRDRGTSSHREAAVPAPVPPVRFSLAAVDFSPSSRSDSSSARIPPKSRY